MLVLSIRVCFRVYVGVLTKGRWDTTTLRFLGVGILRFAFYFCCILLFFQGHDLDRHLALTQHFLESIRDYFRFEVVCL